MTGDNGPQRAAYAFHWRAKIFPPVAGHEYETLGGIEVEKFLGLVPSHRVVLFQAASDIGECIDNSVASNIYFVTIDTLPH